MKPNAPKILVIKSDISELKNVEIFLQKTFEEWNISQKNFNSVFLCVSEAVVNSIEHGNRNDKNKTVSIRVDCVEQQIDVCVYDEGEGFDFNNIIVPTLKENIKKESGRGIHIIKSLTKEVEYNDIGNRIEFKIECK